VITDTTLDPRTPPVVTHPTAVVRVRREQVHPPYRFPTGTPTTPVPVRRELAPQPPAYSAFDTVGKDHGPTMQRQAQQPSIPEWQGVMSWPFRLLKLPIRLRVPIAPHQGMTPFAERVNVDMPKQATLGSQTTVKAPTFTAPAYAKLGWYA
jgi:hypothetical protein